MSTDKVVSNGETGVGSLPGARVETLTTRVKAPVRENLGLGGCRLCGDATVSLSGGEIVITARRAPLIVQAVYLATVLGLVLAMLAVIVLIVSLPWNAGNAFGHEADTAALLRASIFAVMFFALSRGVAEFARRGATEAVRMPSWALRVNTVGVLHRRYVLRGPLRADGKKGHLIVDAASRGDGELLARMFSTDGS